MYNQHNFKIAADSYNYVPLSKELVEAFPQLEAIEEPMDMVDDSSKLKAHWTYDATIMLINKYKHYQPYFADAIHKNDEVNKLNKSIGESIVELTLCPNRFGT